MSNNQCTYQEMYVRNADKNRCQFFAQVCDKEESLINFFNLYFCVFNENDVYLIIVMMILIYKIQQLLQKTTESFIVPSITYISKWLKLSQTFAAVTLITFANGAQDLFTSLITSQIQPNAKNQVQFSNELSLTIGSIFGATSFCSTIVLAMVIKSKNKEFLVNKNWVYRDLIFTILIQIYTQIMAIYGYITIVTSIVSLFLYFLYVSLVVKFENLEESGINSKILNSNDFSEDYEMQQQSKYSSQKEAYNNSQYKQIQMEPKKQKTIVYFLKRFNYLQNQLFELPLKLTIIPCDQENYDKILAQFWPIFGIPFIFYQYQGEVNKNNLKFIIPIQIICLFAIYFLNQKITLQIPKYFIFFSIFGTILGLCWTSILTNLFIDLVLFIGTISNLNNAFLGITFIAIANSLADGLTNLELSRQGYTIMALTSIYSAQIFSIFFGFGLSMLLLVFQFYKDFQT